MTDTMMIRDCIRSQGMKLGHVAHVLGITNNTLRCKLENESEFKVSEAEKLSKMLQSCLLYTSQSPRDTERSRMPSSA